nr:hypothetical protein [Tanacetum cinerariifolium]
MSTAHSLKGHVPMVGRGSFHLGSSLCTASLSYVALDIGFVSEGSIARDVIETCECSVPTDVLDVGEDSNTRAHEEIDNESYRYDLDFAPTPNGTPYWRPDSPEDEKPKLGDIFDTFDDGYNMYKVYSEKGRSNIRMSGIKRYKGKVTHMYVLCNRVGKVRSKFDINTLKEADTDDEEKDGNTKTKRKTVSRVTNCPTLAHRLKVALMGGYDKVRGTPDDYRNFKRAVNLFTGDWDAQMIVEKMINRQLHVPEFSFEHHVLHDELDQQVMADDTMKCNYAIFGDVVWFFVPFTGIDHNQKCVTFGAALLSDETKDSYCWMLKAFLKVHQKQPTLALTDQDAALRNAVVTMFPDSKHRLFEVYATIEDCVGLLMSNTDKLTQFLTTVKEMKKQLEVEMKSSNYDNNKKALYADLLGVTVLVPEQVVIKNPKKSSNKGSKRRKSATEIVKAKKKARTSRKVPFKHRTCNKCGGKGHNMRKYTGKKVMKEDEIQDVDEVHENDEDNASGEDNSSDEDTSAEVESDDD